MPNQMPFGYQSLPNNTFNPGIPNMTVPFQNMTETNKINELEQRINSLEQRVKSLESNAPNKQSYDYQTSMNMM
ncbi:MAG: hypothetical protein ACI4PE_04750 [Bacilli bacterium]